MLLFYQIIIRILNKTLINLIDPKRVNLPLSEKSISIDQKNHDLPFGEKRGTNFSIQSFDKYLSQKPLTSAIYPSTTFPLDKRLNVHPKQKREVSSRRRRRRVEKVSE